MSETKFTPGPWESGINQKGGYSNGMVVRPAGQFPHGEWIADCGDKYDNERIANAELIAAAPDLYAELQKSVEQMLIGLTAVQKLVEKSGAAEVLSKVEKEMMTQIRNVNAALAKARGEKTDEQ